jgi:hypothetical protein
VGTAPFGNPSAAILQRLPQQREFRLGLLGAGLGDGKLIEKSKHLVCAGISGRDGCPFRRDNIVVYCPFRKDKYA